MKTKLNEGQIRSGEERALRLFEERVTAGGRWITRSAVMRYRGMGRAMVRSVYAVARHVEGARLSKSLAKRGVDTVSATAVRTALRRAGDGLVRRGLRRPSKTGRRLARFILATDG